jgi:hypothetical protein
MCVEQVLMRYGEEQVKRFVSYLFDPAFAAEVDYKAKKQLDGMMETIQNAIEDQ